MDPRKVPLPERLRPRSFGEFVGQEHLAGPEGVLRRLAASGTLRSLLLWGPPGCGKTALARLLAAAAGRPFAALSAVTSGVKEVRAVVAQARRSGGGNVVFLDEIHRFNRTQQDALLPYVEDGTLVLVASTTENPAFAVTRQLLSRLRVYPLDPLDRTALGRLLDRALADRDRGLGALAVTLTPAARELLLRVADGDGRALLLALEQSVLEARARRPAGPLTLDAPEVARALETRLPLPPGGGEAHYELASALIKSLRASDVHAALYWLGRLLAGGEDPLFVARRLVIFASEDVGNADPQALPLAVAAKEAVHFVGLPEARFALYQATAYLASAPKSAAVGRAMATVERLLRRGALPVPLALRNAPTPFHVRQGYGQGYEDPHRAPGHIVAMSCLPPELEGEEVYVPSPYGFEREIRKRLAYFARLRARRREAERRGTPPRETGP